MATPTDEPMATSDVISDVHTMEASVNASDVRLATRGVVSDIFKVTRFLGGVVENAKVNVGRLYLRQIPVTVPVATPGENELVVIKPNHMLGLTGVNNWAIYDGPDDSEANQVANAQGMYTRAGRWNQWFTLEFNDKVDKRFKGSTLQVMGGNDDKENEWAIVGGTEEFAMARGIIKRRVYSKIDGITQELTMEFFCRMKTQVVPAPTRRGPFGGKGGSLREMEGKSQRLESVTINYTACVNYIQFSYIDEDGQIRTPGVWGKTFEHSTTKTKTINFGPLEWVKQITGLAQSGYVKQFYIITNRETYGPFGYGTQDGTTPFSYPVPEDNTVVGFCANVNSDDHVEAIGVYTI